MFKGQRARPLLLTFLLAAVLALQGQAAPVRHRLSEYFNPKYNLRYFEVFHLDSMAMTLVPLSLQNLISARYDHVKLDAGNSAVEDFYRALNDTTVETRECNTPDNRWAIVLTYTDKTQQAVGFGRSYDCVELLTGDRIPVSRPLWEYVHHTFPFMR
jgi:hypothetical protein